MENLRVLEGSEVFFRGLQHLYPRFESGWRLSKHSHIANASFFVLYLDKYQNVIDTE